MSAEPNLSGAIDMLSEVAHRIADDRNAYFKAARALLSALEDAREHVAYVKAQDNTPGQRWAERDLVKIDAAIASAKEAGL